MRQENSDVNKACEVVAARMESLEKSIDRGMPGKDMSDTSFESAQAVDHCHVTMRLSEISLGEER